MSAVDERGAVLRFEAPPPVSLWRAALRRGGDASRGVPRVEATAARLDAGDVEAYARVCGFPAVDPLPLSWPTVLCSGLQGAVLTAPAFPLRALGLVHVRQRLERTRAVRRGEALSARCFVEGYRVARRGGEVDLVTEVSAGDGVVWRGVSTILSRQLPGDGQKREAPPPLELRPARSVVWRLPADLGRRYAAVSGDYNPIHLSAPSARLFGYRRAIAHGWWTLARCLAELDDELPTACTVEASFRRPVPLPSTVTFEAGPGAGALVFRLSGKDVCLEGRVAAGGRPGPP